MKDWYNDGIWYCDSCENEFKVYATGDTPDVSFCPICGSRAIEEIDSEDEE